MRGDDGKVEFERIAGVLGLARDSAEYAFAHAFWERLTRDGDEQCVDSGAIARWGPWFEEAVVWRVLLGRMLAELGPGTLFQERGKGAAAGTLVVHPAVDALAKTYERLKRTMNDLSERQGGERVGKPKGLPDLMKPILEEAEVVFDELLGPGGFPGRAQKKGLERGADSEE